MKKFYFIFLIALGIGTMVQAQTQKIIEPNVGFLNHLIMGDTLANGARVDSSTVYILRRNATYYLQGPFENYGWKLHLKAEDGPGKIPYVQTYPQLDGTIFDHMIRNYGDLELENIFFDCQGQDPASRPAGRVVRSEFEGAKITIKGCVLANSRQNGIMLPKATDYVIVDNCHFYNMGRFAFSDFGNGRVFDCRDAAINLFSLTNSTFANSVDRIIRHRGGSGVMKKVIMDHCTIINNMAYHGFVELGNIGDTIIITNNLMVDCFGMGNDSTDVTRLTEFDAHGEKDALGNARMVWVGSIPNDSTFFEIHHNVYTVTAAQQAWYTSIPIDEGPKWILTEHIKSKLGDGAATAWMKKDFTLPNTPATPVNFYEYYWSPTGANKQKITTSEVDYDTKDTAYWSNTFDCTYNSTDLDFRGSDGVPIGDPNWGSTVTGINRHFASAGIGLTTYPNPVSEEAVIEFKLDRSSNVRFEIFDITGNSLRNIDAGFYGAGKNSFVITRENLNTGMYILRINADKENGFTKILVK